MLLIHYERTLYKHKLFKLTTGGGLGISGEELGEVTDLIAKVNVNADFKSYLGGKKHLFFSGLIFNSNPFYGLVQVLIPVGYQYNFFPGFSMYLSYSQFLCGSEIMGKPYWNWELIQNRFLVNLGIRINF
jgi:hypothetical protein